jgi:hypothetical protein
MATLLLREAALASRSAGARMMTAVLRLTWSVAVAVLVSGGVLLLAEASLAETPDLVVIGVGVAFLVLSALVLPTRYRT